MTEFIQGKAIPCNCYSKCKSVVLKHVLSGSLQCVEQLPRLNKIKIVNDTSCVNCMYLFKLYELGIKTICKSFED